MNQNLEQMQQRLGKLSGGVAIIKMGADSELEMKEKKYRVEDALNATRAAVEEGIVPGGGTALLYSVKALENLKGNNSDQNTGIDIVISVCDDAKLACPIFPKKHEDSLEY